MPNPGKSKLSGFTLTVSGPAIDGVETGDVGAAAGAAGAAAAAGVPGVAGAAGAVAAGGVAAVCARAEAAQARSAQVNPEIIFVLAWFIRSCVNRGVLWLDGPLVTTPVSVPFASRVRRDA